MTTAVVLKAKINKRGNGAILENYVLRIHRRKKNDSRILVGVVEEVGVAANRVFTNLDELWFIILNLSKAETAKRVINATNSRMRRRLKNRRFLSSAIFSGRAIIPLRI